jgi:TolB protein
MQPTQLCRQIVTWILCVIAFLSVIACSGCALTHSSLSSAQPVEPAPAPETAAAAKPVEPTFETDSTTVAPMVDVFGEFDGLERPPVGSVSQAGFERHSYAYEGYDSDVAIDPTGKWIAFSSTRHSEKSDIYLQRVDGSTVTQLTSDPADDALPAFSPDGKWIAFCSTRSGNWDIYLMDSEGRDAQQITNSPAQELHPSFSPDGSKLVYCSLGSRSGQWEIWVVDLKTNLKQMIGFGLFPTWSPDKSVSRIAFQRARQRGGRWFSLWTLDYIDGEATHLTEIAVSANSAIVCPSWSPDGKKLTFATIIDPAHTLKGRPAGQTDIWTISADGTNRHRLTDGTGTNVTPYWAVDGRVYFVSDRAGNESIWSVQADHSAMAKAPKESEQKPAGIGAADAHELGQ